MDMKRNNAWFALVIFAIIIVICTTYTIYNVKLQSNIPNTISQWHTKYPSVFNNPSYLKLINQSSPKIYESQAELIGISTNPFRIRDDILEYILTNIPKDNYQGRVAAIKRVMLDQSEIGISDSKMLNAIENKASAAIYCLNLPLSESKKFIKGYDGLLRNTFQRLEEQNRIEHLLSGYVISPDFGIESEDFSVQCAYFLGLDR